MNALGHRYPVLAQGKEAACINCSFCTVICAEFAIYSEQWQPGTAPYRLVEQPRDA